jgi:hypothetical protein
MVRHRLDTGKDRLRKIVMGSAEAKPRLPLVHSTDSYALADVLETGTLVPQDCKVFTGEALTYFFYGRPAFRPNMDAEPSSLKHYFPVCLLFRPEWTINIRRLFPFDSGAFHNELYGAYLHKKMKLGDFGLEAHMETPGKVISRFFGSVPAYLRADPKPPSAIDPAEFEAHSYLALIQSKEGNAIDSRGSGIELQTADAIPIGGAVAAIVLPSTFADGSMGTKLKNLGIDVLPYRVHERSRPGEYTSEITTICTHYYVRIGLVAESEL